MKIFFLLLLVGLSFTVKSQTPAFPENWIGNWIGELLWYKTGKAEPQKVNMELRIHPTDSINTWSWQIIYGSKADDNRPYKLVMKDTSGIHWVIDENNGIVLDQFWVANKLCGAFRIMGNTIINNYWMENDNLMVEFYSIGAEPIASTGKGTVKNPTVDSYKIGSYQKAILQRIK
jgi:hypothetical protein